MTATRLAADSQRQDSLNDVLKAQLQALARIEDILVRERTALDSRDPDGLLSIADAKNRALADLGELEVQRRALSASLDSQHIQELRLIASRCREMNTRNAALLNAQQQHVNRLLSLLRGGNGDRPAAYDSTGRTTATPAQQLRLTQV